MTTFKRSFLGLALYVAVVLILGERDNAGSPIINFASYFYLAVMVALPITLLFPSLSKTSVYIPLLVWIGIYLVLLQFLDRTKSTTSVELSIIVLEIILLCVGVWLAHHLVTQMSYAESLMDALALRAFPNHVQDIDAERQRIKVELTRSRRYQRPLSLLVIKIESEADIPATPTVKSIQADLMSRFTFARVGQVITDLIRQTDLFLRDRQGRYIILCSETSMSNIELFAKRISHAVQNKTGLHVLCGAASFPDEALTFEDLLRTARTRLAPITVFEEATIFKDTFKDIP